MHLQPAAGSFKRTCSFFYVIITNAIYIETCCEYTLQFFQVKTDIEKVMILMKHSLKFGSNELWFGVLSVR